MTNYRLDRRFVLPAVGINVIIAGVAAALAFILASVPAMPWIFGVLTIAALLNAARMFAVPPVVARLDPAGLRIGGPLTVRPLHVGWLDVEDVSADGGRLLIDRGETGVIAFPLAYVAGRANELVREIHERLNTANGYRRFDPTAPPAG